MDFQSKQKGGKSRRLARPGVVHFSEIGSLRVLQQVSHTVDVEIQQSSRLEQQGGLCTRDQASS